MAGSPQARGSVNAAVGCAIRKCERSACGKRLPAQGTRTKQRFCSPSCATRAQYGEKIGKAVAVLPGDRWEKIAPRMSYTDAVRTGDIWSLYRDEIRRR